MERTRPGDGARSTPWRVGPGALARHFGRDPRHVQIAVLAGLLGTATLGLGLPIPAASVAASVAVAVASEWLLVPRPPGRPFDPRSPLISGLSLALLLRAADPLWLGVAGFVAIAGKRWLRVRGKHVFNPTNLAIVALVLAGAPVWVSPGQWGSGPLLVAALALVGAPLVARVERFDVAGVFALAWAGILFGRAAWLGDPLAIPLHQLQSGGLVIFAFLMLPDPRSTPDARPARIVFALAVAVLAGWLRFGAHQPLALFQALALCAPLTPLADRLWPARRYTWPGASRPTRTHPGRPAAEAARSPVEAPVMPVPLPDPSGSAAVAPRLRESRRLRRVLGPAAALVWGLLVGAAAALAPAPASAFCGFYVAKADTSLFNEASQVVLVRDGDRTVITMASDYRGEAADFALVVPVPSFVERGQIHVADPAVLAHLDAYTAPRLVEYRDENPCAPRPRLERFVAQSAAPEDAAASRERAKALGVTVEAEYTVGEYDILILSAEQSDGLATWLRDSGYRIPDGAEPVLESYLKQDMRFFVARVNLGEQERLGVQKLRPIQVAYESRKFMLPIRLGMVNAAGPQEMFVYTLTRQGRVEPTNYRNVRLPTGSEIPTFVKDEFAEFYRAMFARQVEEADGRGIFLEYAWDMAWCDPCAADPLTPAELRELGVFWVPQPRPLAEGVRPGPAQDVFVTRLHLRYDAEHFPEDLQLQVTRDRQNFQGRYVMRHPYGGSMECEAAEAYLESVAERREREVETLASLTGWDPRDIRERLPDLPATADPEPWWRRLWGGS